MRTAFSNSWRLFCLKNIINIVIMKKRYAVAYCQYNKKQQRYCLLKSIYMIRSSQNRNEVAINILY